MKKLVLLLASMAMLAVACGGNTTIEGDTDERSADTETPTSAPESSSEESASSDDDTESDDGTDSGVQAAEPTPAPEPTEAEAEPEEPAVGTEPADDPEPEEVDDSTDTTVEDAQAETALALAAVQDADDWCSAADAVENGTSAIENVDFADPEALETTYTGVLAVVTASARLAPPEIAGDVETSIGGFRLLTEALEEAEWNFFDLDLGIINDLDAEMQTATYNIERYNFDVCGIGEDPGEAPTAEELEADALDLPAEGTVRDQAVLALIEAGFTEEEADCIFNGIDFTDPEAFGDVNLILEVFGDCGIALDRLAELGG